MTDEEIKICLARMAGGKTSDVMNFDYAGTLKYICNLEKDIKEALNLIKEGRELISANNEAIDFLEKENAELRARLEKAVELKFKIGDTIYLIQRTAENPKGEVLETKFIDYEARNNSLIYIVIHGATYYQFNEDYIGKLVFTNKSEAESRLAELKGEKK